MESDFTSHIYPPDSILWAVHLVGLPGCSDRKPLKLLDLEFANSILPTEGSQLIGEASPDYAMQFNEDVSANTLDVDDLERWRFLDVA
jgi:hypothetical protein